MEVWGYTTLSVVWGCRQTAPGKKASNKTKIQTQPTKQSPRTKPEAKTLYHCLNTNKVTLDFFFKKIPANKQKLLTTMTTRHSQETLLPLRHNILLKKKKKKRNPAVTVFFSYTAEALIHIYQIEGLMLSVWSSEGLYPAIKNWTFTLATETVPWIFCLGYCSGFSWSLWG